MCRCNSAGGPDRRSGFEAQKGSHAIQLRLEFALEGAMARCVRFDIAELRLKLTGLHGEVGPANHAVAPKQRQSVIAELAFGRRRVDFETVYPAPHQLEASAVSDHRGEGPQQAPWTARPMAAR